MADSFDLDWRGDDLVEALEPAFQEANELLGRQFTQEITDNKWPPYGDIVDLGLLRSSQNNPGLTSNPERRTVNQEPGPPTEVSPLEFDHTWYAEYALAVIKGAGLSNGGSIPARDFVSSGLEAFDFARTFAKLAERQLAKVK